MGRGGWACPGFLALLGPSSPAPSLLPAFRPAGQAAGSRARWRPRGGERALEQGRVEARKGRQARGWERSLSPCGQDPGRWVPRSPVGAELRPGSQNSKMAKGGSEAAGKARNLQAKHLSKGPRKQWILELERMCLKRERGEGASATGNTTPVSATSDGPTQNIVNTKCSPLPTFLQPPTWERLMEGGGRTFK